METSPITLQPETLTFRLPGRVASKQTSLQRSAQGRMFYRGDSPWKVYETQAIYLAKAQLRSQLRGLWKHHTSLIAIRIILHRKGNSILDDDNAQKGLKDILQRAGVIANDRQIKDTHCRILDGEDSFWTDITLKEFDPNEE